MSKCACDTCSDQFGCDLETPCVKFFDFYYDGSEEDEDEEDFEVT